MFFFKGTIAEDRGRLEALLCLSGIKDTVASDGSDCYNEREAMTNGPFLVVAYDRLAPNQAGPAIRCLALAKELTRLGEVHMLHEGEAPGDGAEGISFIGSESAEISPAFFGTYSAALAPPLVAMVMPEILEADIPLVIDLFDPAVSYTHLTLPTN